MPVVIYDDELSSVIAYALSRKDYVQQLYEIRKTAKKDVPSL